MAKNVRQIVCHTYTNVVMNIRICIVTQQQHQKNASAYPTTIGLLLGLNVVSKHKMQHNKENSYFKYMFEHKK
jgi:hypothetical protein